MLSAIHDVALELFEANGTLLSLKCAILLRYKEYAQLVALRIDPTHYSSRDGDKFFRDSSSINFLRKVRAEIPGTDPTAKAEESFLESERRCASTNIRMVDLQSFLRNEGSVYPETPLLAPFVSKVRQRVKEVLGPIPREIVPRFGPGATLSDAGTRTAVIQKITSDPTCTERAWVLIDPLWVDKYRDAFVADSATCLPTFVRGNRFTTVPKEATTDRPICVEPSLLVYYQKGLGAHLKKRLSWVGIDISAEGSKTADRHRSLVQQDWDSICTIDLSSASDLISRELVRLLLPSDWFYLLDSLRSQFSFFKGGWHRLEKFSSMGNAFTFELETILFACICESTSSELSIGGNLSVFGDDIIAPKEHFKCLCDCLELFGFKVNRTKSFGHGPFRESCGVDTFNGVNVRSFFLKDIPNGPQSFFRLCNGIRLLADRYSGDYRIYDLYRRPWLRALERLPRSLRRIRGPRWLGDSVLYDRDHLPTYRDGVPIFRALIPRPRRLDTEQFGPKVRMAAALYGVPIGERYIPIRGNPRKWVLRTVGE